MPANTRPVCSQPEVTQQSTGQGGAEINRDLEVLFRALNRAIRCNVKLSEFADAVSKGGFGKGNPDSGNDGGGGGGGDNENEDPVGFRRQPEILYVAPATSFTLNEGFHGIVMATPSANVTITLPAALPDKVIRIVHCGTANKITVANPAASSLAGINTTQWAEIRTYMNSSGVPQHPTLIPVFGADGGVFFGTAPNVRDAAVLVQIDSVTKGFLPPRMTEVQRDAIAAPPDGMLVWVTDAGTGQVQVADGGVWAIV